MEEFNRIIKEIDEKQDDILSELTLESIAVYSFLKNEYAKGNILNNLVFQFVFISYYGLDIARLSGEIKSRFFELLAQKQTNLELILSKLYEIPTLKGENTIQFSFATKLLHTIDNDKPIFDSNVEKSTNIKLRGSDKDTKIRSRIEAYDSLEKLYAKLKEDDKTKRLISNFRLKFKVNDEKISDTKVLDFIMWSLGRLLEKLKKEK
jgi:hypothetical protein